MKRKKLLSRPTAPPEGKMFGIWQDGGPEFVAIGQVQEVMSWAYDDFDRLSEKERRREWGADYFDAEINGRKNVRRR